MENTNIEIWKIIVPAIMVIFSVVVGWLLSFVSQKKLKLFDVSLSKKEREEQEIKFYIPLLRCLYELDDRFIRIFSNLHTDWLSKKYLDDIKKGIGFASNPRDKGYFFISTIYLIGCFFGVSEILKKRVDTKKMTITKNENNKYSVSLFDSDITKICRLFQDKELFYNYNTSKNFTNPTDACEIHKHFQHSIGEMMIEKTENENYRVKSFQEFYTQYVSDEAFRFWFVLVEGYFSDLTNFDKDKTLEKQAELKNDIRPLRLKAIQFWCRKLIENIISEFNLSEVNFEERKSNKSIENHISDDLKKLIQEFNPKNKQTYLLGLNIN